MDGVFISVLHVLCWFYVDFVLEIRFLCSFETVCNSEGSAVQRPNHARYKLSYRHRLVSCILGRFGVGFGSKLVIYAEDYEKRVALERRAAERADRFAFENAKYKGERVDFTSLLSVDLLMHVLMQLEDSSSLVACAHQLYKKNIISFIHF